MLKLSLITDEVSQDLDEAISLALKYHLQAIEIRSVREKNPFEFTWEDIREIKKTAKKVNLPICCIASPFFKCDLEQPDEIAYHLRALEQCIAYAQEMECGLIRGFTFWAKGNFEDRWEEICEQFQKPIRLLDGTGVTLALEFDPSTYATNGEKISRIVRNIASPSVKVLWDPGNDIYDPDHEIPYPNGYHAVKGQIAHVHLKDAVRTGNSVAGAAMCRGEVDYAGQFKSLIADGYSGYLSLETHYRKSTSISDALLQMPKGSAFSAFGYDSSAECLENIIELLHSL